MNFSERGIKVQLENEKLDLINADKEFELTLREKRL